MSTRLLPFLLLLPLIACGDKDDTAADDSATDDTSVAEGLLEQGFEQDLDSRGGCSDTWMQVWDADGQAGMELYRVGLIAATSGGAVQQELQVGVDDFALRVEVADDVAINYCTDALSERQVLSTYTAVSGGVTVNMQPPEVDGGPSLGSFSLSDVVFEDEAGHQVLVESFDSAEISVIQAWGG